MQDYKTLRIAVMICDSFFGFCASSTDKTSSYLCASYVSTGD